MDKKDGTFNKDFAELAMTPIESQPDPNVIASLIEIRSVLDTIVEVLIDSELIRPENFDERVQERIIAKVEDIEAQTQLAVQEYKKMVEASKEKAIQDKLDHMLKTIKPAGSA